jgi:hypothetical protein
MLTSQLLARLAPDGSAGWARSLTPGYETAMAASGDHLFVASFTSGQSSNVGDCCPAQVTLDALSVDGTPRWSFTFETPALPLLAASSTGDLYLAVTFPDIWRFGDRELGVPGGQAFVVAKLGAGGALAWVRSFRVPGRSSCTGLAPSPDGGVVLVAEGDALAGLPVEGVLSGAPSRARYLARLDGGGVNRAARAWSTFPPSNQRPTAGFGLAPGPNGGFVIGGNFGGSMSVFGTSVHTGGELDRDFALVGVSPSFELEWLWHFGNGGGDQLLSGFAVDGAGALVLGGTFEGKLDLGSGLLRSAGGADAFLARIEWQP